MHTLQSAAQITIDLKIDLWVSEGIMFVVQASDESFKIEELNQLETVDEKNYE